MNTGNTYSELRYKQYTAKEKCAFLLLILLSFTGISVMSIGKAMLTPFHIAMGIYMGYSLLANSKLDKKVSVSLIILLLYILGVNIVQFPNIRITSAIYTLIYGIEISVLFNLISGCRINVLIQAFKLIVVFYFINLLLGFCLDLANIRQEQILKVIRVYYSNGEAGGRPMGFSSEPSYAAFILSVIFLCYSHLKKHALSKLTFKLSLMVVASILLSKSAYGFIFLGVIALDWLFQLYKKGDSLFKNLFPFSLGLMLFLIVIVLSSSDHEVINRLSRFTSALFDSEISGTEKFHKLQQADASAFARIAPTYLLFMNKEETNGNSWFGAGAGAAGTFLSYFLTGILVDEGRSSVDTGILPAFLFDYGFIGGFLFFIFLYFTFFQLPMSFWLLFLLILPNANINTQLVWFAILCFGFTSSYLLENKMNTKKLINK